jgi:hypothetical protein
MMITGARESKNLSTSQHYKRDKLLLLPSYVHASFAQSALALTSVKQSLDDSDIKLPYILFKIVELLLIL